MPERTRTYIIGDIHGCLDELLDLEARIRDHAARDATTPYIVAVGDLVDRGPASAAVVRHFRAGGAAGTHVAVVGNHEQEMLRVLFDVRPDLFDAVGGPPRHLGPSLAESHAGGHRLARWLTRSEYGLYVRLNWLGQGGAATLASWDCDPHDARSWYLPPADLAFLTSLPIHWQDADAVVTHALADADDLALLRAHAGAAAPWQARGWDHAVQRALWNRQTPARPADPARVHVSGHTPQQRPQHLPRARALLIDTGCAYGRRLTAWCPRTGAYLSVPSRQPVW